MIKKSPKVPFPETTVRGSLVNDLIKNAVTLNWDKVQASIVLEYFILIYKQVVIDTLIKYDQSFTCIFMCV